MHDAGVVSRSQSIHHLRADLDQTIGRHRPTIDRLLESLALHQLHDQERPTLVLTDVVDGADVRVVQSRGGARFPLKALQDLRAVDHLVGQELDRHWPTQASILATVDDAHAATAELCGHLIVGNNLVDHSKNALGRREDPHSTRVVSLTSQHTSPGRGRRRSAPTKARARRAIRPDTEPAGAEGDLPRHKHPRGSCGTRAPTTWLAQRAGSVRPRRTASPINERSE